ncbi:MAG: site-specific integrase [Bacteroidetes bacterium]|nr:site-specific integrase [Bacteroidota bacterium]
MPYIDGLAKPGRFWRYRFSHRGQLHQGTTKCERKADAVAWLSRFRARLALGEQCLVEPPSVQRAYEHWAATWEGKLSAGHLARAECAFRLNILPICGQLRADAVDNAVAELIRSRYLQGVSKHLDHQAEAIAANLAHPTKRGHRAESRQSPRHHTLAGANTLMRYLKTVLTHLVKHGMLKAVPFDLKPLRTQARVRQWIPLEKIPAFLSEVDRTGNTHLSICARAMLYLGMRESEVYGMRWEWFSLDHTTYTPGKTKGYESEPLPVPSELRAWLQQAMTPGPLVMPARDGSPHRRGYAKRAIARAGAVIGLPGLTPHRLRNSCATLLARGGVDAKVIQRMLRHKDILTTMRYIQAGLEDLRQAQARVFGA